MRYLLGLSLAASLVAPAAFAAPAPDLRTSFIKSCQTQMYMSGAACGCLADKAAQQLDAKGMQYLSLQALDVANSTALAKSMSGAEIAKIDHFMRTAPDQCQAAK